MRVSAFLLVLIFPTLVSSKATIDNEWELFENTVKRWDVQIRDKRDMVERFKRLKAFKMSNAAPIKLTHEEQRSLRDATIPAPSVASTSIAATLASFQEAIDGDNSALQKVFAGW